MLWSPAAGDAWDAYLAAYMAGVSRFCLRQGAGAAGSPPQVMHPIMNPMTDPTSDPMASGRRAGGRPASSAASSTGSACTGAADRGRVVDVVARA